MKSTKISFISKGQTQFQEKFFSQYIRYGILGCLLLFFLLQGLISNGFRFISAFINGKQTHTIGQHIELEGEILGTRSNGYIDFQDKQNEHRFLKSNDINLSAFKGKGAIVGVLEESSIEGSYVINVQTIYQIINSTGSKLANKFISVDKGLSLSLQDPNYFIDIDKQDIVYIKDLRTFRPSIKITSFDCDRKVDNKNCGKIIREGDVQKKYDNFISANSIKFYKIGDNLRFTDDKQGRGFHLITVNDSSIYQLSEYITIITKDRISGKIYDRLSEICSNNEFTMTQSEQIEIKKANNNWFAIIKGKSSKGDAIQCEIYIDDSSKQNIQFELANILPI